MMLEEIPGKKLNGMVVDDSGVVRIAMTRLLQDIPAIGTITTAINGQDALEKIKTVVPDVVILDIEMPIMNGIEVLPKLLAVNPKMIVLVSSTLTAKNAEISIKALQLGAKDYIAKPAVHDGVDINVFQTELKHKIEALIPRATIKTGIDVQMHDELLKSKLAVETLSAKLLGTKAIVIGSSTGGPKILLEVLKNLGPKTKMPIFIVQHMLPTFTTVLADQIQRASGLRTVEVTKDMPIENSHIYLAAGNQHMIINKEKNNYILQVNQDPPEESCRPSVNPLFRSAAEIYSNTLLGIVLTGMGEDGLDGAKVIRSKGGVMIAQDRETCAVWGMPRAIVTAKACDHVLKPEEIGVLLSRMTRNLVGAL